MLFLVTVLAKKARKPTDVKLSKSDVFLGVPPHHAAARMTVEQAKGLPPAYIDVGELDIFRDEDFEYAMKLGKAGVSCELHLLPGAPHAFEGKTKRSAYEPCTDQLAGFAPDSEVARWTYDTRVKFLQSI